MPYGTVRHAGTFATMAVCKTVQLVEQIGRLDSVGSGSVHPVEQHTLVRHALPAVSLTSRDRPLIKMLIYAGCATLVGNVNRTGQPPNSCGSRCFKALSCVHRCSQICHAGPCDPCVQGCKPEPPKMLAKTVQKSPGVETAVVAGIAVNADLERAAPRPRAPRDSTSSLVRRMIKRHSVSVGFTITLMGIVGGWTMVIVEPFNHRRIAENNKGVRAIWAFLGIAGFVVMVFNASSLRAFRVTGKEIKGQMERRLPAPTSWLGVLRLPWFFLYLCLTISWVIGPFFRYVLTLPGRYCTRFP